MNKTFKKLQKHWLNECEDAGIKWHRGEAKNLKIDMQKSTVTTAEGKIYKPGVQVNALIEADDQTTTTEEFGPDLQQTALFSFVRQSLVDISYVIEIGDVIDWNSGYWEVSSVNENQRVGGQTDFNHSVICNTFLVRISNLNIESVRSV